MQWRDQNQPAQIHYKLSLSEKWKMNNTVIRDIPEQLTEKDLGSEERDMGGGGSEHHKKN